MEASSGSASTNPEIFSCRRHTRSRKAKPSPVVTVDRNAEKYVAFIDDDVL